MLGRLARARSTPTAIVVGLFLSTFTAVAAQAPYLPVYYESLGFSLASIGLLSSLAALSAWAAAPAWGIAADRMARAGLRGVRASLVTASLMAAASALGLALSADPTVVVGAAILYTASFAGIGPVLDAHSLDLVGIHQHRYARLRVWGSVAFVIGSVVVGLLIQGTEVRALFVVLIGAVLLGAALAATIRGPSVARSGPPARPRPSGLRAVLHKQAVMSFIVAALVVWSASTAVNAFFSIYLLELGAPAALVGVAWALGAIVEIPLMLAFPTLAARFGVERLIVLGAALLLARAFVLVIARDPFVVSASMALHGAGFAFLLVGGVTHVGRHAPATAAATAQGVLSGIVFGLALAVGPGVAGLIAASAGLETVFVAALLASAIGLAAMAFVVLRGSVRTGDGSGATVEAR